MSRASPTAVVLVSGGMDSCVAAAEAAQAGFRLAFLHAGYGQRTARRELRAFHEIANYYRVTDELCLVCRLEHLSAIGGSSLTDPGMPGAAAEFVSGRIPTSYVPFRNAHFLSAAVSWGEVLGAEAIYIGAVEEDSSGYPDCREEYYRIFDRLIEAGTKPETHLRIVTPLIHKRKSEIVRRGVELAAPFHLTWSCYQENEIACGVCESCVLRLRGFAEARVEDPIPYRQRLSF